VFWLITEDDIRRRIHEGSKVEEPLEICVDEGSSAEELYEQISVQCDRPANMIQLWKVDDAKMPTTIIPDGPQKCPPKDMAIFVQQLVEPLPAIPRSMRLAFLCLFVPEATPKVQYIASAIVAPTQSIAQVFPFLSSLLGMPTMPFNVFCEKVHPSRPIHQNAALVDLGISDSAIFVFEPIVPMQFQFLFAYVRPPHDDAVSYYQKIRPYGDSTAAEYFERRANQLRIEIFRVVEQEAPIVTVIAPEQLAVTELPDLILFATQDSFDARRDTFQVFRARVDDDTNETMPYLLRSEVTLRMLFVSEMKKDRPLRLFYDILRGVSRDQLKTMVVWTVDIFDAPLNRVKRIRHPMPIGGSLQDLLSYIQMHVYPCRHARLLLDEDGVVTPIDLGTAVEEGAVLRFDVVSSDQRNLRDGEFLVVALVCRYTKKRGDVASLQQSFLFRIVPDEDLEVTKRRISEYKFADQRLMPWVVFHANGRVVEGALNRWLKPNDILQVVLPDRARTNNLLKRPNQVK
jgi:hypothetical protein